jgi:hypothetical protein
VTQGELESATHHLLDVLARFNLSHVATVLGHDLLLVRDVLDPVTLNPSVMFAIIWRQYNSHEFSPRFKKHSLNRERGEPGEDENWGTSHGSVVNSSCHRGRADINMHNDTLSLATQPCIPIGHGQGYHLVRARYDFWEGIRILPLTLDHCL